MYGPPRDCKRKLEREQALVGLYGLVAYSVARRTHEKSAYAWQSGAGMAMAAAALLVDKPHPTDTDVDEVMSEHICRCGTYQRIRKAIHRPTAENK